MSSQVRWYVFGINPEPWVVPPMSPGRRGGHLTVVSGMDPGLHAYQESVRESFGEPDMYPPGTKIQLTFYLWRNMARYSTEKQIQKNSADATNCQKALEDALQGYLFDNDRNAADVRTVIMDQSPATPPTIVIRSVPASEHLSSVDPWNLPHSIWEQIEEVQHHHEASVPLIDNEWPPRR